MRCKRSTRENNSNYMMPFRQYDNTIIKFKKHFSLPNVMWDAQLPALSPALSSDPSRCQTAGIVNLDTKPLFQVNATCK